MGLAAKQRRFNNKYGTSVPLPVWAEINRRETNAAKGIGCKPYNHKAAAVAQTLLHAEARKKKQRQGVSGKYVSPLRYARNKHGVLDSFFGRILRLDKRAQKAMIRKGYTDPETLDYVKGWRTKRRLEMRRFTRKPIIVRAD